MNSGTISLFFFYAKSESDNLMKALQKLFLAQNHLLFAKLNQFIILIRCLKTKRNFADKLK